MSAPQQSSQLPPGVFACGCLWDGDLVRRDPNCSEQDHGLRGVPYVLTCVEDKPGPSCPDGWANPTTAWWGIWRNPDPEGRA